MHQYGVTLLLELPSADEATVLVEWQPEEEAPSKRRQGIKGRCSSLCRRLKELLSAEEVIALAVASCFLLMMISG